MPAYFTFYKMIISETKDSHYKKKKEKKNKLNVFENLLFRYLFIPAGQL